MNLFYRCDWHLKKNEYLLWILTRFNVDPSTGLVTLAQTLDYEQTTAYQLLFRAQDNGNPSREAAVSLTITVLDYNDFGPIFNPPSYQTSVNEGETNILIPVIVKVMTDCKMVLNKNVFNATYRRRKNP